jgi:hypothetical protein
MKFSRIAFMPFAVALILAVFGCDNPASGPGTDGYMDNSPYAGPDGIPVPPTVVAYGADARSLADADTNKSDGTFYGDLEFIHQVSTNYNSTLRTLDDVESGLGTLTKTSVTSGPYNARYDGQIDGREVVYYTNESGNRISLVTMDPNNDDEIRQIDYLRTTNYKYGRVIFYRVHINNMLDVTEIREFNRRKEFSSARVYEVGTANESRIQLVGLTELVSGAERTTAVVNQGGAVPPTGSFTGRVGVIDLGMTAARIGDYPADAAEIGSEFPAPEHVLPIGAWAQEPADLAAVSFDTADLDRFAGFDD